MIARGPGRIQDGYDILGQSWGGIIHAIRQPTGLKNLIIANSPAHMGSWVAAVDRLRLGSPANVQETLTRCDSEGTKNSEEYEAPMMVYYERHLCRVKPFPAELEASLAWLKKDDRLSDHVNCDGVARRDADLFKCNDQEWTVRVSCQWPTQNIRYSQKHPQDQGPLPYWSMAAMMKHMTKSSSLSSRRLKLSSDTGSPIPAIHRS